MNKLKAEKIITTIIKTINCNRKVAEKILVAHIKLGFNFDIIEVVEKLLPNKEVIINSRECGCGREGCEVTWIEVDGVNISDLVWDIINEKDITPLTPEEFKNKVKKEIETTPPNYGIEVLHCQTDTLMEELLISLGYGGGVRLIKEISKGYSQ